MRGIYLVNYAVKGIKSIDQWISLSFYKKTFDTHFDFRKYNVKGIYGSNGAGKSALISSARILKNIIIDPSYLSNPVIQKQLHALINQKERCLSFSVDYFVAFEEELKLYCYQFELKEDSAGYFNISNESLLFRKATSHSSQMNTVYETNNGQLLELREDGHFTQVLSAESKNLLTDASLPAIALGKDRSLRNTLLEDAKGNTSRLSMDLIFLYLFGDSLNIYLDTEDDHTDFLLSSMLRDGNDDLNNIHLNDDLIRISLQSRPSNGNILATRPVEVRKEDIDIYENTVRQLQKFIRIFKPELKKIHIEKRESKSSYVCDLIMDYGDYRVSAEFESTGIKKLIRLYTYIKKMVDGDIVLIDELDSNLHDVYLCALLEYLMEYGHGQLCFTTHNIGPMDVLKRNRKSIEFLSTNQTVYSWKTSGNYSPSKLYRNGMIEGSPFNIDAHDFICVFDSDEGDE